MFAFAAIALCFSFSSNPALGLIILVVSGARWLRSLNPSNTSEKILANDANRGRVLSVMPLAQQGGNHCCLAPSCFNKRSWCVRQSKNRNPLKK